MAGSNGTVTVKAARPGINLAGQDSPGLAQGLLRLLVAETVSGLYRCEATVGNWGAVGSGVGFLYFDRQTLDFGKAFKVKLGPDTLFDGRIMGLEAHFPGDRAPELTVLAEDRFQDLRMTRRTRTFANVTDADVINQVANDHGLSPSVNVTGPTHQVLAQVNQSDLAFLRERARAIDAELWMDGQTLNARSHTNRAGGPLTLTYQGGLRAFSALADLAGQRTSVTVGGWDVAGKAGLQFEATDAALGGELNGDSSGASVLSSVLGGRKEALAHTVPLTSQEAQAAAEAFFKMSARRFVTGHGVAETDARLRVGGAVVLQGLGPLFSGKYYLTEVRHLFDGTNGLRTEFTGERPGLGQAR
jgi:phage protein D